MCNCQFIYNFSVPLVILFVWVSTGPSCGYTGQCHGLHPDFNLYLGTKTPYRFVANYNDEPLSFFGCTPTRIFGIVRHGTRTPGHKFVNRMKHLNNLKDLIMHLNSYPDEEGTLCEDERRKLKKWDLNVEDNGEKSLTHEGEDEMIELAERFQKRFPSLMTSNYSNSTYFFRYTATQRTQESAKYFTIGLFGRKISRYVWFPEPVYKDPILRFYKLCDRWRKEVKKNPAALKELAKYKTTIEVLETCQSVSKRLGHNDTLSYDEVHLMYTTCCFETAWRKRGPSPWCSVFSRNDLKVMEYAEDLKYYWIDGYGHNINHKQACPIIENLFLHLKNETKTPVTFYFTHSGTLLKLISHMGLYKDEYLLSHDVAPMLRDTRKWRVSAVDAFGTNIVFVLYNCNGEERVLTLHQEKIANLPGCPKDEPCPLSHFEDLYGKSLKECNFKSLCLISD